MKSQKLLLIAVLVITSSCFYGQSNNNKWGNTYYEMNLTGLVLSKVIDKSGFKPIKLTTDIKLFKTLILQQDDGFYKQLNISTWSMCTYKHDEYFEIYNMYYKKITKTYYDTNCKALNAIMIIDGTVKQPR